MQTTKLLLAIGAVIYSSQTLATPFAAIDPRSLGMGGTGVSHAQSGTAGFYNPSMLANADKEDDFSLVLPTIALRLADADDLQGAISDFESADYVLKFNTALNTFQTDLAPANFATNKTNVTLATRALWDGIVSLSDKAIESQLDVGVSIAIPSKKYGMAFVADGELGVGVVADVPASDTAAINDLITAIDGITDPTQIAGNTTISNFSTNNLQTNVSLMGATLAEGGIAMARVFDIAGYDIALGITPKYFQIDVADISYSQAQLDNSQAEFTSDDIKTYTGFNLDIGASYDYGGEYKTGLVIKNLIPQSFKTQLGHTLKLDPLVRVGGSMHSDWYTVAADLDLTENSPLGLGAKSRYLGLGTEADLWILKGRLGYRHNLSDADTSLLTVGLGLYLGLQLDVAAAMNPGGKEYAASVQASINF